MMTAKFSEKLERLNERQQKIARLVGTGLSNRAIEIRLELGRMALKADLETVYDYLDVAGPPATKRQRLIREMSRVLAEESRQRFSHKRR
jgi:DNA-binding CsgD family transcriptional regulator